MSSLKDITSLNPLLVLDCCSFVPRGGRRRFGNMAGVFQVMAFGVRALDEKDVDYTFMAKLSKIATAEMIFSKVLLSLLLMRVRLVHVYGLPIAEAWKIGRPLKNKHSICPLLSLSLLLLLARELELELESMQLSFDARGNNVTTILLLMKRHLYARGGLQVYPSFYPSP